MFSISFKIHSYLIALSCLAACGLFSLGTDARYIKRNSENEEKSICSRTNPCMWEVYNPKDRIILETVESSCECGNGTHCTYYNEDISISALVYRCTAIEETVGRF